MKYFLNFKTKSRMFAPGFALLIACGLGAASALGQATAGSGSKPQPSPHPNSPAPPATTLQTIPVCPPAGLSRLPAQQGTGHHKVILSWNPSSRSSQGDNNAVGYCLYRSKSRKAVKQKPTCRECEQVNSTPVVGTACADDLVQDGTKYYYVVTGISDKGVISPASNEVIAPIPAGKETASGPPGSTSPGSTPPSSIPPPACRGWSSAK